MIYQFIEENKQEFPVVVMCRVLDVSESGYYAWRKRPTCRRKREDARLTDYIRQVFTSHQGRYGSPRIQVELKDQGVRCSRKRVARLMHEAELHAKRKRRRAVTTRRDATHPVAPHLEDARFYGNRAEYEMGHRYHLYSNNTRGALLGSHAGLVFKSGRGMVHVSFL